MTKAKILVVDDEEMNVEIIFECLEDDYDLGSAENGLVAWEMLQDENTQFDLILLDRMMPVMDGMELLEKIKQSGKLNNIPIILQSAKSSPEHILEGMKAGALHYLTKPFEEEMLLSVVTNALDVSRVYREVASQLETQNNAMQTLTNAKFCLKSLDQARHLATLLANACPDPQRRITGFLELLTNAVEHGNLGITFDEKGELKRENKWHEEVDRRLLLAENLSKQVVVVFERNDDEICVTISDEGDGFSWDGFLDIDPARILDSHGRGIAMANHLSFDQLTFLGCGNQVEVKVTLTESE